MRRASSAAVVRWASRRRRLGWFAVSAAAVCRVARLRGGGVWEVQQCSSEQCAVCGALRMRTMRDVDVSTIGCEYKLHVQPTASCGVRFALATCPRQHTSCSRDAGAICLSGIGQDSRLTPLIAHQLMLQSMLASVLQPLVFASFAAHIGPSCSADAQLPRFEHG